MGNPIRRRFHETLGKFILTLYVQNQLNLNVGPTRREQLDGLVGVGVVSTPDRRDCLPFGSGL